MLHKQGLFWGKKTGKLNFCKHYAFGKQCRVKLSSIIHKYKKERAWVGHRWCVSLNSSDTKVRDSFLSKD